MMKQMKRKRSNAREIRTRDKKIPIFKIQFYDHHFSDHHTFQRSFPTHEHQEQRGISWHEDGRGWNESRDGIG